MDIVTHAMTGMILASPLWPAAPLTAAGVVAGSVLPDVDALARLFGKRAFLRWHQTYAHSVPVVLAVAAVAWWLTPGWARAEPWAVPATAAAALLHVGMDASNTLGAAVLAPFVGRRFCAEWVFFVDAAVLVAATVAMALVAGASARDEPAGGAVAAGYAGFLAAYWLIKAALRRRAGQIAPAGTVSLVPSALWPWRFFGCRRAGGAAGEGVVTYRLNAATEAVADERSHPIFDGRFAAALSALPEYRLMRELSPAYQATDAQPLADAGGDPSAAVRVTCLDLRTRNFGGRFGRLDAVVTADGTARTEAFHV